MLKIGIPIFTAFIRRALLRRDGAIKH